MLIILLLNCLDTNLLIPSECIQSIDPPCSKYSLLNSSSLVAVCPFIIFFPTHVLDATDAFVLKKFLTKSNANLTPPIGFILPYTFDRNKTLAKSDATLPIINKGLPPVAKNLNKLAPVTKLATSSILLLFLTSRIWSAYFPYTTIFFFIPSL